MIAFNCHSCQRSFRVKDDLGGRRTKCPQCGEAVVVPEAHGHASNEKSESTSDAGKPDGMSFGASEMPEVRVAGQSAISRVWGAIDSVIDFRFRRYLTPYIIRIFWIMALLGSVLYFINVTLISPFADTTETNSGYDSRNRSFDKDASRSQPVTKDKTESSELTKAFGKIMTWIMQSGIRLFVMIFGLLTVRVMAELAIVVFNISKDLKSMNRTPLTPT